MRPESIKSILVIKPGAIGDLLQITPTIRELKRQLPEARITVMVGIEGTIPLFVHNPHVSEVLVYDRKGLHKSIPAFLRLLWRVVTTRYDMVINFQRSSIGTWLITLAAMPRKVLVYHKTRTRRVHAVLNHLETIRPLGIDPEHVNLDLELHIPVEDEQLAENKLREGGLTDRPLVAVNPGASSLIKCWPTYKFSRLIERLQRELQVGVVVVGGPEERYLYDAIAEGMEQPPLDLVGKTSLLTLGAILKRCVTLVSGDTGPLHLATAVGARVVALFGAIDPDRTGPMGIGHVVVRHTEVPCVPCMAKECMNPVYLECMEKIEVDEVFDIIAGMVRESAVFSSRGY
jgi:lipopolysaccharide heptosyltransferase II